MNTDDAVEQKTLNTERLVLRPFQLSDGKDVQRLAGDKRIAEMVAHIPHPYEDGMAEAWILTHAPDWAEKKCLSYAVCTRQFNELIGCVGVSINAQHKKATLGYWVGVEHWGQGYCTEAAKAVVSLLFNDFNMNRIDAMHLSKNPASGAVMMKLGMQHEGRSRQHLYLHGEFEDVDFYAVLANTQYTTLYD